RRAVELASEAIAVNPRDAQALSGLALYHAKLAQIPAALRNLKKALAVAPEDSTVVFSAALVYAIAGRMNEALDYLSKAMRAGYSRHEIEAEPELRILHDSPRYHTLMRGL